MTTLNEAREAIYGAFQTGWVSTGVAWTRDNEAFEPPQDASWARLSVRHQSGRQDTLGAAGGRKFARTGAAFVQIFTPIDDGVQRADGLSETARAIFEGERLTGTTVRFIGVSVREQGPEGAWYRVLVEAPFEYDETK